MPPVRRKADQAAKDTALAELVNALAVIDSGIQAAWSFNLALRARGLGTAYATMLNSKSDEVAAVPRLLERSFDIGCAADEYVQKLQTTQPTKKRDNR